MRCESRKTAVVRRTVLAVLFAGVVAGLCTRAVGQEKSNATSRYVKVAATAGKPRADGNQTITIVLDIDRRCRLFANPVGHPELEDRATRVTIRIGDQRPPTEVNYPAGVVKKDSPFTDCHVYEGRVSIDAVVQRAAGDSKPVEVAVRLEGLLVDAAY